MDRFKALAILAAGAPGPDASAEDRAAFLTALNKVAAEHISTAVLEAASFRELEALRELDAATADLNAALSSALRS